jgi:hypothetical protein
LRKFLRLADFPVNHFLKNNQLVRNASRRADSLCRQHRPVVSIEAWLELGMSRETAELRATFSDAFVPDAAAVAQSPVKPGYEERLIVEVRGS